MLACVPVCPTISIDVKQVFFGVSPPHLEGVRLLQVNLVSGDQLVGPGMFAVKKLPDERVTLKWQIRWNEIGKGRVTYECEELVPTRESSIVDFSLQMGFLLTAPVI